MLFHPKAGEGLGLGLLHRHQFDGLALAVEAVEFGGHAPSLDLVLKHQQLGAQRSVADAPARIDARPDDEAKVIAARRTGGARAVEEGAQAHPSTPAHDREALGDEGSVEALEGHHIGHRGQRHEVQAGEQIGLGAGLGPEAGAAQAPVKAHQGHEGDAGGAEGAEARQIVLPVRIDQRRHRGQRLGLHDGEVVGIAGEQRDLQQGRAPGAEIHVADRAAELVGQHDQHKRRRHELGDGA